MENLTYKKMIENVTADVPPESMIENETADDHLDSMIENKTADGHLDSMIAHVTADVPSDSMSENVTADVPPDSVIENVAAGVDLPQDNNDKDNVTVDNPYAKKSAINNTALLVQGHKLYVSKAVLSLVSPVFRSMFELNMQEKNMDEIPLPGKCFDDMVEFLECIYPDKRKPITGKNAGILVPLFDEYQFDDLKASCQRALVESCTDDTHINTILDRLLLASTYDMAELRIKCLNLASRAETSTLKSHRIMHELPPALTVALWQKVADNRDTDIEAFNDLCRQLEGSDTRTEVCSGTIFNYKYRNGRSWRVEHKAYHVDWKTESESYTDYDIKSISQFITPIKMAIARNFPNALDILIEMCAANMHYMRSAGSSCLLKYDLPDNIKARLVSKTTTTTYPDIIRTI